MGLFTQYTDQLPSITGVALGETVRIPLTRDFPREGFIVTISGTSSAHGTINRRGLLEILKRCRLVANDGASNRTLVDADGLSLLTRHVHYNGSVDKNTLKANRDSKGASTGAFSVSFPHFFAPGSLNSPTRDLFLQNFPRFNSDPVLELQIASAAEIAGSFALTGTLTIVVNEFKRLVDIRDWRFINTSFETFEQSFAVDAPNQRYQIPIPGYHFAIGMRPLTSASAYGDISQTGGLMRVKALNTVERTTSFAQLQMVNQYSAFPIYSGTDVFGTSSVDLSEAVNDSYDIAKDSAWFDYLTDQTGAAVDKLDTVFNSNLFVGIGASPELQMDIAGGSGKSIVFMHDRCFGDIDMAISKSKLVAPR